MPELFTLSFYRLLLEHQGKVLLHYSVVSDMFLFVTYILLAVSCLCYARVNMFLFIDPNRRY